MDAPELLRRYCINDPRLAGYHDVSPAMHLDWRTTALVRISALIAVSASQASMQTAVDDAIVAGVSSDEIVAVLHDIVRIIGLPRAVTEAPRIAVALGYADDLDIGEGA